MIRREAWFLELARPHQDRLPGGLADQSTPDQFDPADLQKGLQVELEHTKDHALAQEIAMDHLTEDPDYYNKLDELEA